MRCEGSDRCLPNKALQPTVLPPLRCGKPAAELGRWAAVSRGTTMRERWTITQATHFKAALLLFDRVFAPPAVANELPEHIRPLTFGLDLDPGGIWLKFAESEGQDPKLFVQTFLSLLVGSEDYAPETSFSGITFRALAGFCSQMAVDVIPSYSSEETCDREFPRHGESIAYQAALESLPVVDAATLEWGQVLAVRADAEALRKLRDLRLWLETGLRANSVSQAHELIQQKIEDYAWTLKKHGLKTKTGALAALYDWRTPAGAGAAGLAAGVLSGPIAAALASGLVITGKICVWLADRKIDRQDAIRGTGREIAFLYDVQRRFSKV